MDRLLNHQYHNRNGYRLGYTPESASSDRCSRHHNQRGYVRRAQGLTLPGSRLRAEAPGITSLEPLSLYRGT